MPDESDRTITVIIPTRGLPERSELIRRAIDSVAQQEGVRAVALVVVNGSEADPAVVRELRGRAFVRLLTLETASMPAALAAGRRAVRSRWFAELDDDDLLLPHALEARLGALLDDPTAAAAVSNGIIRGDGADRAAIDHIASVAADPLAALCSANWLSPGGALFRTDLVPAALFDGMPRYLEWTYLAMRLAQSCKLVFLADPSFVHFLDTPRGMWNSPACTLELPHAFRQLLGLELPDRLRRVLARRHSAACSAAARAHLRAGRLSLALTWHVQSLANRNGLRHLPFLRDLLAGLTRA